MFSSQTYDHKHTDTGHPFPDFYLQNTCKFAVQSAPWTTALAMGATQKDVKVRALFPFRLYGSARTGSVSVVCGSLGQFVRVHGIICLRESHIQQKKMEFLNMDQKY